MPPPETWLAWLHLVATLGWLAAALALLARPPAKAPQRTQAAAAALLAACAMPLVGVGGWWVDMPGTKMLLPLAALAAVLAGFGSQHRAGRPATLALAAWFLTIGAVSIRNSGPLPGFLALKSMLLGAALLCLPWRGATRLRALLIVVLLLAAGGIGVHRDIPFG